MKAKKKSSKKTVKRTAKSVQKRAVKKKEYKPSGVVKQYKPISGDVYEQQSRTYFGVIKRKPIDNSDSTFGSRF